MVRIKALTEYYDMQRRTFVVSDEEYEVTETRANEIINAGYAQAVKKAAVTVSKVQEVQEPTPKPKRARRANKAE